MSDYFNNLIDSQRPKTVISIYSDYFKNKNGDFVYDPSLKTNLIQINKLLPDVVVDQSRICIYNKAKLSTFGITKLPILDKIVEFHVVTLQFPSGINGIVGNSFLDQLKLSTPEFLI